MHRKYADRARFLTVYIKEAHPEDEWQMDSNEKEDVCYPQPKTLEQRVAIANDFVKRFHYDMPPTRLMPAGRSASTSWTRAERSCSRGSRDRSGSTPKRSKPG